jgi:lycopene beta-cyclase
MSNSRHPLRIAIVGAGLAGLSVALALQARKDFSGEVHLFEPRLQYTHDRHWSFWLAENHFFSELPQVQFQSVNFVSGKINFAIASSTMPYCVLSSDAVYNFAESVLSADSRFKWHRGKTIVEVATTENKTLQLIDHAHTANKFDLVFDSRSMPASGSQGFRQWFIGAEITIENSAQKIAPCLMDFYLQSNKPIGFFYVLPLSNSRVLVQLTYFLTPGEPPPENVWTLWHEYVANALGLDPGVVLRKESGCIPMQVTHTLHGAFGHHAIGTAAGWVRAATGYGFLDIQRAAMRVADACCVADPIDREQRLRAIKPRSTWDDKLDTIFLATLQREPQHAADFFSAIFNKPAASDSVIRFLSGTGTWRDRLNVMRALPVIPFLKSVL